MKANLYKLETCIISAGGRGTRLEELTKSIPKPLFPIDNISCIERTLRLVSNFEIKNVYILTCYKQQLFKSLLQKLEIELGINITIIPESKPLGECGGLWNIKDFLEGDLLFINADLIWDVDLQRFFTFHIENKSDVTLFTHKCSHPNDSDLIGEFPNKQINNFSLKPHKKNNISHMFLGNSGIAILNSKILKNLPRPEEPSSFCNYFLSNSKKYNIRIFSYNSTEFVRDIGTPKRFIEVEKLLIKNLIYNRSYVNQQTCLFIDRDKTLINCPDNEYITSINQVNIIESNVIKLAKLSNNYSMTIIITNQPQIAMGIVTWNDVISINSFIINKCQELGLKIDSFNLCPHHNHRGFNGEIVDLKYDCFCRKPKPGLFFQESYFRNIKLSDSLMVGDSHLDEISSKRAGCNFLNINDI
tara:strand:+ start:4672 stop:5919 length:1248 start_codon:yes stop_codon:yes gene_type:complete